ncbi:hypothetical protein B7463_g5695, partial [Scytalidium lignicola]
MPQNWDGGAAIPISAVGHNPVIGSNNTGNNNKVRSKIRTTIFRAMWRIEEEEGPRLIPLRFEAVAAGSRAGSPDARTARAPPANSWGRRRRWWSRPRDVVDACQRPLLPYFMREAPQNPSLLNSPPARLHDPAPLAVPSPNACLVASEHNPFLGAVGPRFNACDPGRGLLCLAWPGRAWQLAWVHEPALAAAMRCDNNVMRRAFSLLACLLAVFAFVALLTAPAAATIAMHLCFDNGLYCTSASPSPIGFGQVGAEMGFLEGRRQVLGRSDPGAPLIAVMGVCAVLACTVNGPVGRQGWDEKGEPGLVVGWSSGARSQTVPVGKVPIIQDQRLRPLCLGERQLVHALRSTDTIQFSAAVAVAGAGAVAVAVAAATYIHPGYVLLHPAINQHC